MQNVKQKIAWSWQNAEKILVVVFLATFTLNIRKVFLTPYSFFNGGFNDYLTFSLNWADILMIAVILIYTMKWILSQLAQLASAKLSSSNVIHKKSSVIRNYYGKNVHVKHFSF